MIRAPLVLSALLALAACAPVAPAASVAPVDETPRAFVSEGGFLAPLKNGGRVQLADGWAQLYFAPYPPQARTDLDVVVYDGATGRPASADVSIAYEMLGMEHGVVTQRAAPGAPGHHRIPLNLGMPGMWRFQLKVLHGGATSTVLLIVPEVGP